MKKINVLSILLSLTAIILSISILFYNQNKISNYINTNDKSKIDIDDFEISKLHLSKDSEDLSYYDGKYITYNGEAEVSCEDTKHDYLLICELNLISGGSSSEDYTHTEYQWLIVSDGNGIIKTYDYGEEIEKPVYDIKILGFIKLEN